MGRAPCCEKVGLKRGRWTAEEDEILTTYIQIHGEGSWRSLPKNAGLLRCGKSCRLRWINYLRSGLKRGNITPEEENLVIKLHATMGNRWSLIAGHLPGRTDNEIKNYWNSHLSRKIDTFIRRRPVNNPNNIMPAMDLVNKTDGVTKKRRGGRTSRSAMKITKEYRRACKPVEVPKLSPPIPPSEPPKKDHNNTTSSPVGIMPATPSIDKEKSMLSSAISWSEENLESFLTESYTIDDVLMLDDDELINKQVEFGTLSSCLAECREVSDNSNEKLLTFDGENFQSLGTMECDNMFCNLMGSENQDNGQLSSWCPNSPVISMLDDEGQIGNFDKLGCDVDSGARGDQEEGILSWLWDTSHHEGDEFVDVEKQNAMVSWLLS